MSKVIFPDPLGKIDIPILVSPPVADKVGLPDVAALANVSSLTAELVAVTFINSLLLLSFIPVVIFGDVSACPDNDGKVTVLLEISKVEFISAPTIAPSTIFADVTESSANLEVVTAASLTDTKVVVCVPYITYISVSASGAVENVILLKAEPSDPKV